MLKTAWLKTAWLKTACLLFAAMALAGEGDCWDKMRELASGGQLRIYQAGAKRPLTATLDRVSDEALIVVHKDKQISIPRERVERVDWRPGNSGNRVTGEARRNIGSRESAVTGRSKDSSLPANSTSAGIRIEGPPGFRTVYRRR
jgi:hypothetical protein